ncbi:hypothetical protein Gotri_028268, partial [Gossypium trilobum]|nr:hypothetical protein [Gossypium trilobum]
CTKLVDVHPSIGVLKSLKLLNLRDCKSLRTLPTKIGMESLETLILSGCSSLIRFPEIDGKMEFLKTLDLSGCYRLESLSENLQQSKFLEELDLSETAITEPPSFIFQLKNIKILSFNGAIFVKEIFLVIFLVYPVWKNLILVVTISSAYLHLLLDSQSLSLLNCQIATCAVLVKQIFMVYPL